MKDLEFVEKIVYLLDDDSVSRLIVHSTARGLEIPGFQSKRNTKRKIPMKIFLGTFNSKNRKGKYNYEIVLESIIALAKENIENEVLQLALKWKEESSREEIEKKICEMIEECSSQDIDETVPNKKIENDKETNLNEITQLRNIIESLKDELSEEKTKKKNYKAEIQKKRIEISNLKQDISKYIKELERIKKENEELSTQLKSQTEITNQKLADNQKEIEKYKSQLNEMQTSMKELELFKSSAPKVLCISKNATRFEIPGYNIEYVSNISEEFIETYNNGDYKEVWYIKKGFQHGDLIRIKEIVSEEKLLLARDSKDLISKIQGGE